MAHSTIVEGENAEGTERRAQYLSGTYHSRYLVPVVYDTGTWYQTGSEQVRRPGGNLLVAYVLLPGLSSRQQCGSCFVCGTVITIMYSYRIDIRSTR